MRWTISLLTVVACSHHSNHSPDAAIDTPTGGTALTITTYRASGPVNTQLVAVQDGDGPWTALTGTAGVYTATVHGDRYGVLTSCVSGLYSGASLWYAAISDSTALYLDDCADPGPASAGIRGSVTGAPAADATSVLDAYFDEADVPAGTTAYTLSTFVGAERLIAEDLVNMRPVKLATVDGTVADGATVNFDLSTGFAPVTHALSGNGITAATLGYRDAHGIAIIDRATTPFNNFRAIPADKLGSGLNRLTVGDANGSSVIRYFKDPVDQQITLPAPPQLAQQPTATKAPYPAVHFMVPVQAGTIYDLSFSTTNMSTMMTRGFSIEMTPAWIAKTYSAASIDYAAPDLHALAGWTTDFQPEVGIALDWSVSPTKNTNVDWFPSVAPGTMFDHDGSELAFTGVSGQLAAP
jgi:hypothetical protein